MSELPVVVAEPRAIAPLRPAPLPMPVPQAVAVAATSFLAGVVTIVLARRRSARKLARRRRRLPVLGSRSFLVDIHLLDR